LQLRAVAGARCDRDPGWGTELAEHVTERPGPLSRRHSATSGLQRGRHDVLGPLRHPPQFVKQLDDLRTIAVGAPRVQLSDLLALGLLLDALDSRDAFSQPLIQR